MVGMVGGGGGGGGGPVRGGRGWYGMGVCMGGVYVL